MKVLILGTSNSILKNGWVAGLRHALPSAAIENRSVGASPGVQFALLAHFDYSKYDAVFFDSVPNDQEFSSLDVMDAAGKSKLWEAVLYDLFSIISSQTCLIVVGFCHRNLLSSPCRVYSSRECLAQILGVQFIDVRGILNRLMEAGAGSPADLYEEHPAHVRERLAFTIGHDIGSLLKMQPTLLEKSKTASSVPDRFVALWAEDTGQPTQTNSNSLLELRTARLKEGYEVTLPSGLHCLGFSLDIARTHCCLQLLDPWRERVADYLCYHAVREDSVSKVFVPVLCKGNIRSLRVAACSAPGAFQTLFSEKAMNPAQPIQLALSAVSFWKNPGEISKRPRLRSNADILHISREISARLQAGPTLLSEVTRGSDR